MEPGGGRRVVGQRRLDADPEPEDADPDEPAEPSSERTEAPAPPVPRPPIDWSVPSGEALRARQMAWLKERARYEAGSTGTATDSAGRE
jgi:hypothetical protein